MHNKIIPFFALLFLSLSTALSAEDNEKSASIKKDLEINLEAGISKYYGYTMYRAGGLYADLTDIDCRWFPKNKIKFPVNTWMFDGSLSVNAFKILTVGSGVKKSISPRTDKMKFWDSTWNQLPKIWTIHGECDNRIKAVFSDTDVLATLFSAGPFSFRLGLGFLYQNFDFRCSNLFSANTTFGYPSWTRYGGKFLTYKVEYYIPYLEARPVLSFMDDRLEIILGIKYSPYTKAKDLDDRIQDSTRYRGTATGKKTVMCLFSAKYMFDSRVYLTVGMDYLYLLTRRGTQKQYYYYSLYRPEFWANGNYNFTGVSAKTQNRYESSQISLNFGVGYSIGIL